MRVHIYMHICTDTHTYIYTYDAHKDTKKYKNVNKIVRIMKFIFGSQSHILAILDTATLKQDCTEKIIFFLTLNILYKSELAFKCMKTF